MTPNMRARGRLEAIAACVSGVLFLVTLVWPDWIERAFGIDPDAHSGAVEWAVVAVALCATIVFSLLARGTYRRARALSPK
ncbi:ABC transporter permease [Streptomyces sp. NPDC001851]|uniref:ABC transporter permease n=1 Tax=Streptomyces sp. NPDC001851 TaxID=3154529 RepID=UPI00332630DF